MKNRRLASGILLASIVVSVSRPARARTSTWSSNPETGNWNQAPNWDALPVAGADNLVFGLSSIISLNNDFAANSSFLGLTINSGASAFTLGGNAITLGGNITNNSTSLQTINLGLALSGSRTPTPAPPPSMPARSPSTATSPPQLARWM